LKNEIRIFFGAGIFGLSAAHELAQLGYSFSVYEATDQPGGFFKSSRLSQSNMPKEYSWHGMGSWYHNVRGTAVADYNAGKGDAAG